MIRQVTPTTVAPVNVTTPVSSGSLVQALVSSLKHGEGSAAEILQHTYSASLYGLIRRHVQDDGLAENVLRLTFEKVLLSIADYNPAKLGLFTWMTRIARQLADEELRDHLQEQTPLPAGPTLKVVYTAGSTPGGVSSPKPIDAIEPKYRMILNLIYFQGFSAEEIAGRLNMPIQAVKSRLAIAIRQLRLGRRPE
jgi:RNA polymerase sigma-70 factor (ECF subfamily)